MDEALYPTRPPYSALTRVIGQQGRELHPRSSWDEVARELEALWASYVTGLTWADVVDKIRAAWEDADPHLPRE